MTIKATCPECQTTFNFDDDWAGRRVRCDHCDANMFVSRWNDDPERDGLRQPQRSGSSLTLWILLGVVLLVVVGGVGGGGLFAWWIMTAVNNIQANLNGLQPGAQPLNIDEAVAWLQLGGVWRENAADWLTTIPVDPKAQAKVAAALENALDDPNEDAETRDVVLTALARWATRDNVPALTKSLEDGINDEVVDALIRLGDERGPKALAEQLASVDAEHGKRASQALRDMNDQGVPVEDAVGDFLVTTKDVQAKREAIHLLEQVGTRKSVPKLEKVIREDKDLQEVGQDAIRAIKDREPAK